MALVGVARREGAHFQAMPVVGCAQAMNLRAAGLDGAVPGSTTMPVERMGRIR